MTLAHPRFALLSVADKRGIVELAQGLVALGFTILSTGGTAAELARHAVAVTDVSSHTGFPELMHGRLKTLHPKIHGGLLGRRGVDDAVMAEHGIAPIDLVAVNLYPFAATVAQPDCTLAQAIEQIDIGGPTLLRAAAKNHAAVTVLCDCTDYPKALAELRAGAIGADTRFALAVKAFAHTAAYDAAIANYLGSLAPGGEREKFPGELFLHFRRQKDALRYGENPHQAAAFYLDGAATRSLAGGAADDIGVAAAACVQGKALSFNNLADADAALECVRGFDEGPACVIVKHANPCGVALGQDALDAYQRAYRTDPTSAFGGIIALNRPLDARTAQAILERQFVEVIIAPEILPDARKALAAKPNVRVLATGAWQGPARAGLDLRRVNGGLLVQERDTVVLPRAALKTVSRRAPTETEARDLWFAWRVAKFVKSNAIVYARDGMTIGVGAGQMSRVISARIAAQKAAEEGLEVQGAVMASDAFFPFRDGIDAAAVAGITAVIQPGGSVRDEEVIAAANEHGMAMLFTGMRHFRH